MTSGTIYCLDANVLIMAWREYYAPDICPDYWKLLSELGRDEVIFLPQMVAEEITRVEDDLSAWLKSSAIPIHQIDGTVTKCLRDIYDADPLHKRLVDSTRQRSLADPWVIAHAMKFNACVVTRENKETAINTPRIKIPNVCEKMGVRCINDFQMVKELDIKFSCRANY